MARYSLSLDDATYERIRAEAEAEGRSIANMLRRLVDEALAARDERAGR